MHELALMADLVEALSSQLGTTPGARVEVVRLEVGELVAAEPAALQFCFETCARGTTIEGARLEIRAVEATERCRACGTKLAMRRDTPGCRCGSLDLEESSGRELRVFEVEVS